MANTKKVLEEDFTKARQAETAEDVNNQDARTRLWQSLNTTYNNQIEESNKAYEKAISQASNSMLAKGTGRSSFANQTIANLYNDMNKAANKLGEARIADYQNRIGQIEAQEKEEAWRQKEFEEAQKQNEWSRKFQEGEAARQQGNWEKDYAANRADTAWSQNYQTQQFNYQKLRDSIADQQWQKQYNEQLRQFNENMAFQKQRANVSDAQWQKQYDEELRRFNAQMAQQESEFKRNLDFQANQNALNRTFQTFEREAQQNWQAQQNQLNRDAEKALQMLQNEFTANQNALSRQAQKDLQILSQNWQSGEAEKNRKAQEALQRLEQEFQKGENAKNREAQEYLQKLSQAFTAEQNALNRKQSQSQFEIQQAFNEKQWEDQKAQWREDHDYNAKTTEQKLNYDTVMYAIQIGKDVSDEMLSKAGISRADFNSMKAQVVSSGSAGNPNKNGNGGNEEELTTDEKLLEILGAGNTSNNKNHAQFVSTSNIDKNKSISTILQKLMSGK